MKLEEILEEVGSFGRYQMLLLLLLVTPRLVLPCHYLLNNFIGAVPPHRCRLSGPLAEELRGNLSREQWLKVSVPAAAAAAAHGGPDGCSTFLRPQLQLLRNHSSAPPGAVACQSGWLYDNTTFASTIATEWDLVCERRGLAQSSTTIFFMGVMCGAVVFGFLCDRYGRRRCLLLSYLLSTIFGVSSALANSFATFAVLRFLTGFGLSGVGINSLVLNIEWVDSGRRSFVGVLGSLAWSAGNMLLAAFAFLINDWRPLMVAVTAPLGVAILTWRWVPESARWLLTKRKIEQAQFYLDRCADVNKRPRVPLDSETLHKLQVQEHQDQNYTYLHLIKTPKIRRLTLLMALLWYGVASTYYGISLNIGSFGLNIFLTHFIYAAVEVPAKLAVYVLLNAIGRRKCQAGSLLLTGACIAINIFLPKELWLLRSLVAVLGKGLSEASFTIVFLYTSELYPTVVRQKGLGYCNVLSRVGVATAPLILLLEEAWPPLPQIVLCGVSGAAGLAALLLPETLNVRLPETIQDVEGHRSVQAPPPPAQTEALQP